MPIVTLTTDFGTGDHYAALLKGSILSAAKELTIIDISHNINNYDIVQAAFVFKNAWHAFPQGTIHVITVNDLAEPHLPFLLLHHRGHFFIGPDNGIFTLIFSGLASGFFRLEPNDGLTYPLKKLIPNTIAALSAGRAPATLGSKEDSIMQRITFQPVTGPDLIRGSVIYIDNYENAIVNIDRALFERIGKGRHFNLFFKRHDPITQLSRHYYEVPVGEPLCRFNSESYLEIAINMGRAASLLGLAVEETIQIDFETVTD